MGQILGFRRRPYSLYVCEKFANFNEFYNGNEHTKQLAYDDVIYSFNTILYIARYIRLSRDKVFNKTFN